MTTRVISIILPAHNEAAVIARTLAALPVRGDSVFVVCNACTDGTAEVARSMDDVCVLETDVASKTHALNVGDGAASDVFPRFYIDADVVLPAESLERMTQVLQSGQALAVAPTVQHDLAGASWAVRAFYDIDSRLPSRKEGIGGSGVYGLSKEGRQRFGQFPTIIADDLFVRLHFAPHERVTVADAFSVVTPPKTLKGVIATKTRSHFGNYEIEQRFPELLKNRGAASNRRVLMKLCLCLWLWPKLGVYACVKIAARIRARRRIRNAEIVWERDETSRRPMEADAHV